MPRTRAATRRCTSPRRPDICRSWRRCWRAAPTPHAVDAEDKTPLSRAAARNHTAVVRRDERAAAVAVRDALIFTSVSGIPVIDTGMPRRPSNFTGGRSWNMKSHFQRSDGLDACSQVRAETGRANVRLVSPA